MKKKRFSILLLIFINVLQSCISKSNIDVEIPSQQKKIVAECYLVPGYPAELTLTESNILDEELVLRSLANAQAYIVTDSGTIHLEDITFLNPGRQLFVNYSSKDTIYNNHSFFTLNITNSQGIKLQASTSIVSQVELQNVKFEKDAITVHHNIINTGEHYFKLLVSIYKGGKHEGTNFGLYQQSNNLNDSCTLPWKDYKADADSMVVTLYHIQKDYYDYLRSVRNASSALRDPFLTPEAIQSNIKGGIGIFTYYTLDRRSFSL